MEPAIAEDLTLPSSTESESETDHGSIPLSSTCINCSLPLSVNGFVADYALPPDRERRSVHQVVELIFKGQEPVEELPNTLKFCSACGSIFAKVLLFYNEFLRATSIGSYIHNLRNEVKLEPPEIIEVPEVRAVPPIENPSPIPQRVTRLASASSARSGKPVTAIKINKLKLDLDPLAPSASTSRIVFLRTGKPFAAIKIKKLKLDLDPLAPDSVTPPLSSFPTSPQVVNEEVANEVEDQDGEEFFQDILASPSPPPDPPSPRSQETFADLTKKLKCDICHEILAAGIKISEHRKTHGDRPYVCLERDCNRSFPKKHNLKFHTLRKHPNATLSFKVDTRAKRIVEYSEEVKSLLTISEYKCDNSSCSADGVSFSTFKDWVLHQELTHNLKTGYQNVETSEQLEPINALVRPCPQCGKKCKTNNEIIQHFKRIHARQPPSFQCDVCGKLFRSDTAVKYHKENIHSGSGTERNFLCALCGAAFASQSNLSTHEQTHYDQNPKKYECKICHAKFISPCHVQKHSQIHSNERPYPCDQCQLTFKTEYQRNRHKHRQHVKKFIIDEICEFCGKGFAFRHYLKDHLMSVHKMGKEEARISCKSKPSSLFRVLPNGDRVFKEKPTKPKTCDICQRTYVRREQLYTHLISIHGRTEEEAKEFTGLESKRELVKKKSNK